MKTTIHQVLWRRKTIWQRLFIEMYWRQTSMNSISIDRYSFRSLSKGFHRASDHLRTRLSWPYLSSKEQYCTNSWRQGKHRSEEVRPSYSLQSETTPIKLSGKSWHQHLISRQINHRKKNLATSRTHSNLYYLMGLVKNPKKLSIK